MNGNFSIWKPLPQGLKRTPYVPWVNQTELSRLTANDFESWRRCCKDKRIWPFFNAKLRHPYRNRKHRGNGLYQEVWCYHEWVTYVVENLQIFPDYVELLEADKKMCNNSTGILVNLPGDVLVLIGSYFDYFEDIMACSRTCSLWNISFLNSKIWQRPFLSLFGESFKIKKLIGKYPNDCKRLFLDILYV